MIICDDQHLIRAYLSGYPGSVHDNCIFRNVRLSQQAHDFSPWEYLLGDSAFKNHWYIVSAYKKPTGLPIPREYEIFNDALASPRVLSEHTIGMRKGCFPWLRSIRSVISEDKKSLRTTLQFIEATMVLHNLLAQRHDNDIPYWDDDITLVGDAEPDELNEAVPDGSAGTERRRQLTSYINEFHLL